jgi:hypothetical protein
MKTILTVAIAATALCALGGAAKAEHVCQWTGHDWACGDGNTFPEHYSQAEGPNLVVTPIPSPVLPPGQYLPNIYGMQPPR